MGPYEIQDVKEISERQDKGILIFIDDKKLPLDQNGNFLGNPYCFASMDEIENSGISPDNVKENPSDFMAEVDCLTLRCRLYHK